MSDPLDLSNPDVTQTRIRVVSPGRKLLLASGSGVYRLQGMVTMESSSGFRVEKSEGIPGARWMIHEEGSGTLLAGDGATGLFTSEDQGRNFQARDDWEFEAPLVGAIGLLGGQALLADSKGRLLRGTLPEGPFELHPTWDPGTRGFFGFGASSVEIRGLTPDPTRPQALHVSTSRGHFLSRDRGKTFSKVGSEDLDVSEVLAFSGGRLLGRFDQRVCYQEAEGASWVQVDGVDGSPVQLARDVAGDSYLAIETAEGGAILRFCRDRLCFQPFAKGLPRPSLEGGALAAESYQPGHLYYGSEGGFFLVTAFKQRLLAEGVGDPTSLILI